MMLLEHCRSHPQIGTVFVELICTDPELLEQNITEKQFSPDYRVKI
jgi:hypothetical protein